MPSEIANEAGATGAYHMEALDNWSPRACHCGCERAAREGSKYHEETCRPRAYRLRHPTVDLSGLDAKAAKRAERMISDAVEAAKQGLVRATIDSRHPVKHEKDERPSCRPRLSPEAWEYLKAMAADAGMAPSALVEALIFAEAASFAARTSRRAS